MLVDEERSDFNQLLLKSHHVVERLIIYNVLSKFIEDFDQLFRLVDEDFITLDDQALHLLCGMIRFCFSINLSRYGLVKIWPSKGAVMLRQHRTC